MMNVRDRLYQKVISSKSDADWIVFKLLRNRVVNNLRESKIKYYHNYFDENKNNMKILWKGINNIIRLKTKSIDSASHPVGDNGSHIYDSCKMANEFNHFFTNVATEITKTIPRTPKYPLLKSQKLFQEHLNIHYHT